MKERLIAFLSAVVRDYASKEGEVVHRIELIGGSARFTPSFTRRRR